MEIEVDKEKNESRILVDTRFYGYLAILQAANIFTQNCFVYLDGDPYDKVVVVLQPMTPDNPVDTLGNEFHNCMLSIINSSISHLEEH